MPNDFDKLRERVEAAGGYIELIRHPTLADFIVLKFKGKSRVVVDVKNDRALKSVIALIHGYLDSLEDKAKARRCVELIEAECDEDNPDARFCATEIGAGRICAGIIRREFGIEGGK